MVRNLLLIGASGTGKSTSMRNLPLEKTVWIDTEKKSKPFRGQKRLHTNVILTDVNELIGGMDWIEEQEDVEYVVLDSFTMLMDMFYMQEIAPLPANKTMQGWGNYKTYAMQVVEKMKASKKFYIVTALVDTKMDRFGAPESEVAKVQGSFSLEPHFTVVAHTNVVQDKDTKELKYGMLLGRTSDRPLVSSKAPFDYLDGKKELNDNDIMILANEVIAFIEE